MRRMLCLMIGLLSLTVPVSGCSENAGSPDVEQKIWILESLADESLPVTSFESVMPHATLADGNVSGNLTVNTFNGTYELSGDDIDFSPLATTKKAGPPEAMEQETQFLTAFGAAGHIEVQDGMLTVSDSDGTVLMRLTEALEG